MNLKGSLPLLILHILSFGPSHGYQINKLIHQISESVLDFKEGTLYPTLHKLEGDKLIKSSDKQVGGRHRRVYHLTKQGQRKLDDERAQWEAFTKAVDAVLNATDVDDYLTND